MCASERILLLASCFSDLLPLSSVSVSTVAGVFPTTSLYLDLLLFHPKIECDCKAAIYRLLPPVDWTTVSRSASPAPGWHLASAEDSRPAGPTRAQAGLQACFIATLSPEIKRADSIDSAVVLTLYTLILFSTRVHRSILSGPSLLLGS